MELILLPFGQPFLPAALLEGTCLPRHDSGEHSVPSVLFALPLVCPRWGWLSTGVARHGQLLVRSLNITLFPGHSEVVRFLLEACKVNPEPKDR